MKLLNKVILIFLMIGIISGCSQQGENESSEIIPSTSKYATCQVQSDCIVVTPPSCCPTDDFKTINKGFKEMWDIQYQEEFETLGCEAIACIQVIYPTPEVACVNNKCVIR